MSLLSMSRKYRQAGYQDDDGKARRRPAAAPTLPNGEGPSGRGLGQPTSEVFRCRDCGRKLDPAALTPASVCDHCGVALHACVQCAAFDPSARHQCRLEIPAPQPSKVKANDCGLFRPKLAAEHGEEPKANRSDPRSAFDDLFR